MQGKTQSMAALQHHHGSSSSSSKHGSTCSNRTLDFSWIRVFSTVNMHSFRLRYIVLGLLIYIINSASCRTTCGSPFNDVPSRAYLASIIFEGTVHGKSSDDIDAPHNVTFKVKKVLKGVLPERKNEVLQVIVGTFGPEDPRSCRTQVVTDGKYVVFLKESEDPLVPFYKLSGLPEPSDKKALRDVRKQICAKCAKPPTAKLVPKDPEIETGRRLQLRCKYRGRPQPVVQWLKNDRPIRTSATLTIDTGKRSSRLRIRNATPADSGIYSCKVVSVVGEQKTHTSVTITQPPEEPHEPSPSDLRLCDQQAYCLNGGTCFEMPDLQNKFCRCTKEHIGDRCQHADIFTLLKTLESREEHEKDRNMTITGLVIAFLIFLLILLASYCLARRKRIKFEKRKKEKQRAASSAVKESLPANGLFRPLLAGEHNGPITRDMAQLQMFGAPPPAASPAAPAALAADCFSASTQTDDNYLCDHPPPPRYQSPPPPRSLPQDLSHNPPPHREHKSEHKSHKSDHKSNHHHHSAPPPPPPSTPVQFTVAVVESDPDKTSRQSSPSQTSKTESMHGENKAIGGASGGGSLDYDQRSDYDNQPRRDVDRDLVRDLERDLEHEEDIEEEEDIDMILQQERGMRQPEEEEEEEDSSNGEEEKALFLKIHKPAAPKSNHPRNSSGGGGAGKPPREPNGGASRNHGWDEYGNMPPSHAMDHFALNRYANDDDIIENRPRETRRGSRDREREYESSHGSRDSNHYRPARPPKPPTHKYPPNANYSHGYNDMYDPDPDATIV